jgi:2-polyprenyl-6-methoxyphenol hydroxylase-like FAD-dependent oxidoreductase
MKTDVLIVGAGPTGLSLACQLIRHGVDFHIVDRKESTTPYSKAIGVQARTLEIYQQIGLAEELISLGRPAESVRLFSGGEVRGRLDLRGIGTGLSPYPFVLIVEQGRHESLLHDFIKSNGQDVQWRTTLESFEQDDEGVTAYLVDKDGSTEIVRAKYMVACDGAKSPVRHSLGLEFEGSTVDRLFYVADVDIDWEYGDNGLFVFLMRNNLLVIFAMKGDRRFRIVGTFPEEFAKDEGDVLYEEIEQQLRRDTEVDFDITKVHWFSTYRVHTRHVDKFSDGRVFLAGDAAHIHTPAGAQGMNTGIQDGYNLAWKLASVLKGDAAPRLLGTYNEERLPNAENLTRTTDRLFELIASPNPLLAFARTQIFPLVAGPIVGVAGSAIFPRISQIGIEYRHSSLSKTDGGFDVKAGDRMPWFEIDGASIYDRLHKPVFHVLLFGAEDKDLENAIAEMKEPGLPVDFQRFEQNEITAKAFGTSSPFVVVLRPDNYIGMISDEKSAKSVTNYLNAIMRSA